MSATAEVAVVIAAADPYRAPFLAVFRFFFDGKASRKLEANRVKKRLPVSFQRRGIVAEAGKSGIV